MHTYEFTTTAALRSANKGSHETLILFRCDKLNMSEIKGFHSICRRLIIKSTKNNIPEINNICHTLVIDDVANNVNVKFEL